MDRSIKQRVRALLMGLAAAALPLIPSATTIASAEVLFPERTLPAPAAPADALPVETTAAVTTACITTTLPSGTTVTTQTTTALPIAQVTSTTEETTTVTSTRSPLQSVEQEYRYIYLQEHETFTAWVCFPENPDDPYDTACRAIFDYDPTVIRVEDLGCMECEAIGEPAHMFQVVPLQTGSTTLTVEDDINSFWVDIYILPEETATTMSPCCTDHTNQLMETTTAARSDQTAAPSDTLQVEHTTTTPAVTYRTVTRNLPTQICRVGESFQLTLPYLYDEALGYLTASEMHVLTGTIPLDRLRWTQLEDVVIDGAPHMVVEFYGLQPCYAVVNVQMIHLDESEQAMNMWLPDVIVENELYVYILPEKYTDTSIAQPGMTSCTETTKIQEATTEAYSKEVVALKENMYVGGELRCNYRADDVQQDHIAYSVDSEILKVRDLGRLPYQPSEEQGLSYRHILLLEAEQPGFCTVVIETDSRIYQYEITILNEPEKRYEDDERGNRTSDIAQPLQPADDFDAGTLLLRFKWDYDEEEAERLVANRLPELIDGAYTVQFLQRQLTTKGYRSEYLVTLPLAPDDREAALEIARRLWNTRYFHTVQPGYTVTVSATTTTKAPTTVTAPGSLPQTGYASWLQVIVYVAAAMLLAGSICCGTALHSMRRPRRRS